MIAPRADGRPAAGGRRRVPTGPVTMPAPLARGRGMAVRVMPQRVATVPSQSRRVKGQMAMLIFSVAILSLYSLFEEYEVGRPHKL